MKKILKSFGFYALIFSVLATLAFTTPPKSMVTKVVAKSLVKNTAKSVPPFTYWVPVDVDDPEGDYEQFTGDVNTIEADCPEPFTKVCVVLSASGTIDADVIALIRAALANPGTQHQIDGKGNEIWLYRG